MSLYTTRIISVDLFDSGFPLSPPDSWQNSLFTSEVLSIVVFEIMRPSTLLSFLVITETISLISSLVKSGASFRSRGGFLPPFIEFLSLFISISSLCSSSFFCSERKPGVLGLQKKLPYQKLCSKLKTRC